MNQLRCLHCGHLCDREDIWILPYIGQRCTACAILVLSYWQANTTAFLDMIIKKAIAVKPRYEEAGP